MKKQNKNNENGWRLRLMDLFKFRCLMPLKGDLTISASTLVTLIALIITIFIGLHFSEKSENQELFLLNIISTLIGVLGALLIFCIGLDINKKQENKTKNNKLKELYQRYEREITENTTGAGDLISTNELSPYKFRTLIRDNSWGTDYYIIDSELMKKLEHFYYEVDRIIHLLSKINWEKGETPNINAYSKRFELDVSTASRRIRIHGEECLIIINRLLEK